MLSVQYRMHQLVMQRSSRELYNDKIEAHSTVTGHSLCDLERVLKQTSATEPALILVDIDGCDMEEKKDEADSTMNEGGSRVVIAHAKFLIEAGVSPGDVGIITPYSAQVGHLREMRSDEKYQLPENVNESDPREEPMACKVIKKEFVKEPYEPVEVEFEKELSLDVATSIPKQAQCEIQVMKHFKENYPKGHSHLVNLKQVFDNNKAVHIMTDLCSGGDVYKLIYKQGKVCEARALKIMCSLMHGIKACHSVGVMHRNIKLKNMLFVSEEEDANVKLCDFGHSTIFECGDTFNDLVGSLGYMAPEVIKRKYGIEVDLWSAGVVLFELLSGHLPFLLDDEDLDVYYTKILKGVHKNMMIGNDWECVSDQAKELICRLLDSDPKTRMTVEGFFAHPWIMDRSTVE